MAKVVNIRQAEVLSEAQIQALSDVEVARLAERLPEERDRRIAEYHGQGLSDTKIAEKFGMSHAWASKWRAQLGLASNGVGGRPKGSFHAVETGGGTVVSLPTLQPPPPRVVERKCPSCGKPLTRKRGTPTITVGTGLSPACGKNKKEQDEWQGIEYAIAMAVKRGELVWSPHKNRDWFGGRGSYVTPEEAVELSADGR